MDRPPAVDYDAVAPTYDERYDRNRYDGVRETVRRFVDRRAAPFPDVAEVGCGTGHWLAEIRDLAGLRAGVDRSWGMLGAARSAAPDALLVRASAERLPWHSASFDRVLCINALHHFPDAAAFVAEAGRVLRPGGGLLTIGLDPHVGQDRWWIYDYFPSALHADLERYAATHAIRALLGDAGFSYITTGVAQHMPASVPFHIALERGQLDRRSTSQLMVISDADYEAGMQRLSDEKPILRADLRLYATVGWMAA